MTIKKIINDWVKENYGQNEIDEPSWNIELLAKHIESRLKEEQRYLDARYDLICNIIKEFFDWYDKAISPDNDCINAFVCEQSKEIDDIIETFNKEK